MKIFTIHFTLADDDKKEKKKSWAENQHCVQFFASEKIFSFNCAQQKKKTS